MMDNYKVQDLSTHEQKIYTLKENRLMYIILCN